MVRSRLTFSALAVAPLLASVSAQAADYYQPPPPPIYQPQPIIIQQPAVEFASNWYLRGQVGIGMTGDYEITTTNTPPGGRIVSKSIGDSMFFGAGVGYEWNSWLRFDVTAEYRAKAQFTALGRFSNPGGGPVFVDQFRGDLKSYVFLANTYVDLGTWDCFTPFVGVGLGGAWNTVSNLTDVTPLTPGGASSSFGVGHGTSQFSFAWALYAGLTYNVSKSFKVDLTYRYLDFGTAKDTITCNGGCTGINVTLKDLHANDFMLAFRWLCCEVAPPPRIVYTPPPPPPIQSKG
jgi:opacity protein-like surface antigen